MKHLALLFLFAIPLSAQAPSDPVKDFMAEHAQMELTIKQLTVKVTELQTQLKAAQAEASKCKPSPDK